MNPDLNAIEMIWGNLKGYIGRRHLQFRMTNIKVLIKEGTGRIGEKEWSAYCTHVEKAEQDYWKSDIAVEAEIERIVIHVDSDSDVSDDSDEGTDTASKGDETTESAEESKLFL